MFYSQSMNEMLMIDSCPTFYGQLMSSATSLREITQSIFLLTQLSVLKNISTIFWFSTFVYELFCYVRRQLHAQPRQAVRGFEEKEHILQPFKSRNKFPSQILSYVPSVSRRIYENGFVIILFSLSYHSFLTRGLTESFEEIFSRILCESS